MPPTDPITYLVLYGHTRTQAQDIVQLCRALNGVEVGDTCKVILYQSGAPVGSGLYTRTVPDFIKCIAPLVSYCQDEEEGAATGLGGHINARARAVVNFLELQTRLTWHLRGMS